MHNFSDEQIEAAAKAIADCHNPGMFEKYPENWRVEARAALVAAQGAAPQATVVDLIETKTGLLLAHSAFDEGASAMLYSINQTQPGDEWSRPENPYWKALGPVLTAERASTAKRKSPKDIHEPNHDRVHCVRCGGNWPCQAPQAEAYDHCCNHPKCPGGSLCCCASEQRLRDCWNQWREEIAGDSRQAFRDGYQAGRNDPAPWLTAPVLPSSGVDEEKLADVTESIIRENWEMFEDRRHQAQVIARAVIASRAEWLKEQGR